MHSEVIHLDVSRPSRGYAVGEDRRYCELTFRFAAHTTLREPQNSSNVTFYRRRASAAGCITTEEERVTMLLINRSRSSARMQSPRRCGRVPFSRDLLARPVRVRLVSRIAQQSL